MPSETTIGVSKKTVKELKRYQKEFDLISLDEAIRDSIQWARAFIYIDAQSRRRTEDRVTKLEYLMESFKKTSKTVLKVVMRNERRIEALENRETIVPLMKKALEAELNKEK